jgi:hypothetical protein
LADKDSKWVILPLLLVEQYGLSDQPHDRSLL